MLVPELLPTEAALVPSSLDERARADMLLEPGVSRLAQIS